MANRLLAITRRGRGLGRAAGGSAVLPGGRIEGVRMLLPVCIQAHPAPFVIKSPPRGTPFQPER